jgi:hypothetical protein
MAFPVIITNHDGVKIKYKSAKAAASALGVGYMTVQKLASMSGYTKTGFKIEWASVADVGKPAKASRRNITVKVEQRTFNRIAAESTITGKKVGTVMSELMERAVAEFLPPIAVDKID